MNTKDYLNKRVGRYGYLVSNVLRSNDEYEFDGGQVVYTIEVYLCTYMGERITLPIRTVGERLSDVRLAEEVMGLLDIGREPHKEAQMNTTNELKKKGYTLHNGRVSSGSFRFTVSGNGLDHEEIDVESTDGWPSTEAVVAHVEGIVAKVKALSTEETNMQLDITHITNELKKKGYTLHSIWSNCDGDVKVSVSGKGLSKESVTIKDACGRSPTEAIVAGVKAQGKGSVLEDLRELRHTARYTPGNLRHMTVKNVTTAAISHIERLEDAGSSPQPLRRINTDEQLPYPGEYVLAHVRDSDRYIVANSNTTMCRNTLELICRWSTSDGSSYRKDEVDYWCELPKTGDEA